MNPLFETSPFKPTKNEKSLALSALKKFSGSPLAYASKQEARRAKKIWESLNRPPSKIFIFAFGGISAPAKIAGSLFPLKNQSAFLIDSLNKKSLSLIRRLNKAELKSARWLFISKSGKTKEALFYKSAIKKIYDSQKLFLKKRFALVTRGLNSPLLKWAKKKEGQVFFSKSPLPGRFSFFELSGLLLFQAYGLKLSSSSLESFEAEERKALEFLIHHFNRKEIFFCYFSPRLRQLARWLEMSWSESLFKTKRARQAPALRAMPFSDLRHAFIEELMGKKDQALFWALDTKPSEDFRNSYEPLLKRRKIPFMFMKWPLESGRSLAKLLKMFYKIIFCAGDLAQADIYSQPWVDYLKNAQRQGAF